MTSLIILVFGSVLIWALFALIPYLWWKGRQEMALHAGLASVLAWVLAHLVKEVWYLPRPYLTNGETPIAIHVPANSAFPSAHAAAAIALAVSIWLHDGRLGWIALVMGMTVGIARVLANIHYPIDILGGVVLGAVIAVMINRLHPKVEMLIKTSKK
jgi:undecaprenyl-diphosphatase